MHIWEKIKESAKYAAVHAPVRVSDSETPATDDADTPADDDPEETDPVIPLGEDENPPPFQPIGSSRPRPPGRNHAKRAKAAEPVQTHMVEAVDHYNENSRIFIQTRVDRERARSERDAAKEARERMRIERQLEWEEQNIMGQDLSKMNDGQRMYWEQKMAEVIARRQMRANHHSECTPSGYYPDLSNLNHSNQGYPPNN